MAEASITVAVRVRPFSEKEKSLLPPDNGVLPFLGDGGLAGSPLKTSPPAPTGGAMSLRTRFIRSIIHTIDDKVLIFDPPDNNPLTRLYSPQANYMTHGAKRAKDVRYAFDKVLDADCGQEDVFESTTKPLLDGVLSGFNASVFAYGATGCGKTHTISGTSEQPGVIFLTMKELYQRIEDNRADSEVTVSLSYLEIYNETIRDLLSETPTPPGQGLLLREDNANKMSVVGITQHTPATPADVLAMIQEGNCRRTMSPTEANAVSSRSHAVLQINVTSRPRTGDVMDETTSASLNIIDLAGSERAAATRNNGARMKEGANINKSLLALGNCINALCQSGMRGKHIPYRNSKLTRLLKFSLGGNCKTVMIVCVSPSSSHYDETSNTLKYANQAKNIRTKVSRNITNVDRHVAQYVQTIHELREEVRELKERLTEGGAAETDAERRRKAESKTELDDLVKNLTSKCEDTKQDITKRTIASEGNVRAAEIKQELYRKRLDELASLLKEWSGRASPGEEEPTELTSEQSLLRHMLQAETEKLAAAKTAATHVDNAANLFFSAIASASRNSKLLPDDQDRIKTVGARLKADVEAARARAGLQSAIHDVRAQMMLSMTWLRASCRSTVDMKDVAGELEWRADSSNLGDDRATIAAHLRDLADQLLLQAKRNDELFSQHAGGCVTGRKAGGGARRRMANLNASGRRRARPSFTATTVAPGTAAAAAAPSKTYSRSRPSHAPLATAARRLSTAPSTGAAVASPRRVAGRRQSVSRVAARPSVGPAGSAGGRRMPNARSGSTVAAAIPETSVDAGGTLRKSLRWASDVEGGDSPASNPPATRAHEPRRSTTPPWSPVAKHATGMAPSSEWEDVTGRSNSPEFTRGGGDGNGAAAEGALAARRDKQRPSGPPRSLFNNHMAAPLHLRAQANFADTSSEGGELTVNDLRPKAAARPAVGAATSSSEKVSGADRFGVDENASFALRQAPYRYPPGRRDSNIGPSRVRAQNGMGHPSVHSQFGKGRPSRPPVLASRPSSAAFAPPRERDESGPATAGTAGTMPKMRSASSAAYPSASFSRATVASAARHRPSIAPAGANTSMTTPPMATTSMFSRPGGAIDVSNFNAPTAMTAKANGGGNTSMSGGGGAGTSPPVPSTSPAAVPTAKARGPPGNTAARSRQSTAVNSATLPSRRGVDVLSRSSSNGSMGSRSSSPGLSFDAHARRAVVPS